MLIYFIIFSVLGAILGLMAPKSTIPWVVGFITIAFLVFNPILAIMIAAELSAGAFIGLWVKSGLVNKQRNDE